MSILRGAVHKKEQRPGRTDSDRKWLPLLGTGMILPGIGIMCEDLSKNVLSERKPGACAAPSTPTSWAHDAEQDFYLGRVYGYYETLRGGRL